MYNMYVGCPTVADAMVLLSYSYNRLNAMLVICNDYANKWRYSYNSNKCAVLVFNEHHKLTRERLFMLGDSIISEASNCVHIGVKCGNVLSSQCCVRDACNTLRGTLLSITNSGFPVECLNPIPLRTIYNLIVIPKALYGCEVWATLYTTDMQSLERSHRFCIKYIQSMSRNTS